MISQFYLASIHPECAGSVGNALRRCLGTRVHLKRFDPKEGVRFENAPSRPVACLVDMDGVTLEEARKVMSDARGSGVITVIIASDVESVPADLIDEFRVWACISTLPEGRFRHSIQSVALDLINFQMLNEVENSIRSGYHRTTRG
ncbi:MAG: hypothetical protein ACPGN3_13690 [Opitutales bacterium]